MKPLELDEERKETSMYNTRK